MGLSMHEDSGVLSLRPPLVAIYKSLLGMLSSIVMTTHCLGQALVDERAAAGTQAAISNAEFHLPQSHIHSLYFKAGSADLSESALDAITRISQKLSADALLKVTLMPYSDESEISTYGAALAEQRVSTVVAKLLELGVSKDRLEFRSDFMGERNELACSSEYCRQSYRRIELVYSHQPKRTK